MRQNVIVPGWVDERQRRVDFQVTAASQRNGLCGFIRYSSRYRWLCLRAPHRGDLHVFVTAAPTPGPREETQ